jgi:DNA-binding IclR family transcriptional regulator
MQALADRLGVSVALAAGNGQDMLYVAYRAGNRVATLRLGVGSVLPMATTAIGRAWLWGLSEGERSLKLAALMHAAGPRAASLDSGIRASFGELQGTGTCAVLGGYQRNAFGVALPVRIGRQRVVMGLSCGRADLQPDLAREHRRITPALKDAALALEAALADFDGQP